MRLPALPKTGLYWKAVPLILAALSLLLFAAGLIVLAPWIRGWVAVLTLLLLSLETFFLPYALVPLAAWLPTRLPWVTYDPRKELSIDGEGRLAQRIMLGTLIVLSGLPVLSTYDAAIHADGPFYTALPLALLSAAKVPCAIFAVLAIALAFPDVGGKTEES